MKGGRLELLSEAWAFWALSSPLGLTKIIPKALKCQYVTKEWAAPNFNANSDLQMKEKAYVNVVKWLQALRRHSRLAYAAIILFVVGQLFFTVLGFELSPFRNYGMYSEPKGRTELTTAVEIVVNGDVYDYYQHGDLRIEVLRTPVEFYSTMYSEGAFRDPNEVRMDQKLAWLPKGIRESLKTAVLQSGPEALAFRDWYLKHFQRVTGVTLDALQMFEVRIVTYSWALGRPERTHHRVLFTYAAA
jgi:hypothetical protein